MTRDPGRRAGLARDAGAAGEIRRLREALVRSRSELATARAQLAALLRATDRDEIGPQIARERAAYERGRADARQEAYDRGRVDEAAERDRQWDEVAQPIARGGPSHAELEERRWGPGGRAAFGQPLHPAASRASRAACRPAGRSPASSAATSRPRGSAAGENSTGPPA